MPRSANESLSPAVQPADLSKTLLGAPPLSPRGRRSAHLRKLPIEQREQEKMTETGSDGAAPDNSYNLTSHTLTTKRSG